MSFLIEEIKKSDFLEAFRLLRNFNNPHIHENHWLQLFQTNWKNQELPLGFKMIDSETNKIIGIFCLIILERTIESKSYKFYNGTGWIIDPDYGGYKLGERLPKFVFEAFEGVITFLTPSHISYKILNRLGCKNIESSFVKVYPCINTIFKKSDYKLITSIKKIKEYVSKEQLTIIDDHRKFKGRFFLILDNHCEYSFGVLKNRPRPILSRRYRYLPTNWIKHLPEAEIHYLSNPELFRDFLNVNTNQFLYDLRIFSISVESRYLKGYIVNHSKKKEIAVPKLYYGNINPELIDSLYSEIFLFNH